MKGVRHITAWLLAAYLLAAFMPAVAALNCRCSSLHAHLHAHGHRTCDCSVCALCGAHGEHVCVAADKIAQMPCEAAWSAPCCDHRHSTEIELYTSDAKQSHRHPLSFVCMLPTDERPMPVALPCVARIVVRDSRIIPIAPPLLRGLRAPPCVG